MTTDTPLTDSVYDRRTVLLNPGRYVDVVPADFARELERLLMGVVCGTVEKEGMIWSDTLGAFCCNHGIELESACAGCYEQHVRAGLERIAKEFTK